MVYTMTVLIFMSAAIAALFVCIHWRKFGLTVYISDTLYPEKPLRLQHFSD
jgi:hypothetical protein